MSLSTKNIKFDDKDDKISGTTILNIPDVELVTLVSSPSKLMHALLPDLRKFSNYPLRAVSWHKESSQNEDHNVKENVNFY